MEAIIEGIVLFFRLVLWAAFFLIAAVLGPPVLLIWTLVDRSRPYWPTFWRRYRTLLLEAFSTSP